MDRRDDVGPGLVRDGEARPGDRREDPVRVGHHVADDVDPAEDSFSFERRPGAVVGAEQEPGEAVGLDAVPLLRHLEVAASKPGLDVGERERTRPRRRARPRASSSCRRRRARGRATRMRSALRSPAASPRVRRVQVEAVPRLREPELIEEHLRHDVVPVLARVEDDLLDSRLAERSRDRHRLDELWAVPHDGEDLHGRATLLARRSGPVVGRRGLRWPRGWGYLAVETAGRRSLTSRPACAVVVLAFVPTARVCGAALAIAFRLRR